VTSASGLDIDHMAPLDEAWDSGASAWSAQRRERYANDQGQEASLVAVTATLESQQGRPGPGPLAPICG
jgi:hypothetical protein